MKGPFVVSVTGPLSVRVGTAEPSFNRSPHSLVPATITKSSGHWIRPMPASPAGTTEVATPVGEMTKFTSSKDCVAEVGVVV